MVSDAFEEKKHTEALRVTFTVLLTRTGDVALRHVAFYVLHPSDSYTTHHHQHQHLLVKQSEPSSENPRSPPPLGYHGNPTREACGAIYGFANNVVN